MPSLPHELLVDIVREHPNLVLRLLRAATDLPLPDNATAREVSTSIVELRPAEYRADAVLVFSADDETPILAIVVEVQLKIDGEKRFAWPLYVAGVRARLRCPVLLVVLALDDEVGAWCGERIVLGPGESCISPTVIGTAAVPIVREAAAARRDPELAILSLLAHARSPSGPAIGSAILHACDHLDEARAVFYADLVFERLDPAAMRDLERQMDLEHYEIQSEFLRRIIDKNTASAEERGRAAGRQEGREEGREEGRVATLAASILHVLEARGLPISEAIETRVRECDDAERLERWLVHAATASAADDVVAD